MWARMKYVLAFSVVGVVGLVTAACATLAETITTIATQLSTDILIVVGGMAGIIGLCWAVRYFLRLGRSVVR